MAEQIINGIIDRITDEVWKKLEVINREGMAPQEAFVVNLLIEIVTEIDDADSIVEEESLVGYCVSRPAARHAVEALETVDVGEDEEVVCTIWLSEMVLTWLIVILVGNDLSSNDGRPPWSLREFWNEIFDLSRNRIVPLLRVYREANEAPDTLAKNGSLAGPPISCYYGIFPRQQLLEWLLHGGTEKQSFPPMLTLKDELHRIDVAYTIINHLTDKFWEKLEVINREGMAPQEELVVKLSMEIVREPTARPAVESLERIDMEEDKEGVYTICMYEMDSGTVDVKAMPCSHRYHRECIVAWLESGSSCAVCRYQLPTAN
ncbi:uncharacterized protein LOC18436471 [Amborella trichopoda]|uniref:uncharacterized protein LOC18436471 n=1 Tax=Amborella trichopoda TaxID=13333 RepID=UPI0005D36464|nr:uncharacterized protein LOC18436471 [Amborella trichopoda]|eukprot:XP_011624229.1 uncharacterized protein LOC18436471 [Amborella trichopoda]